MSATPTILQEPQQTVLTDCIRQQRQLVLTHNTPKGWLTFRGAWLQGSRESGRMTVQVALPPEADDDIVPRPGVRLGGTFRLGHKKCMFCSEVRGAERNGDSARIELSWPNELQQLQRRVFERAVPPQGTVIAVRYWPENSANTGPSEARTVRHGQLEDLSCGGMRLQAADPADLALGCTYRCSFAPRPGKPAIVVDAILRHRQAADSGRGRVSLGFQFVGLETEPGGLRTLERLARLVSHLHRAHSRHPRRSAQGAEST
ncbi:MAG: PilZ domain-containing protein [Planctomycetota bacterium]